MTDQKQGAKKVIFTACHSGKLKLTFTSPNIISTSPQNVLMRRLISQFSRNLNSSKNFTCPSGKLITEFTSPIARSTSLGQSDTTFFARWEVFLFFLYGLVGPLAEVKVLFWSTVSKDERKRNYYRQVLSWIQGKSTKKNWKKTEWFPRTFAHANCRVLLSLKLTREQYIMHFSCCG